MSNAKIGTLIIIEESARGQCHPPVILTLAIKPDQGVLPSGLLLEDSASGLVPWDPDPPAVGDPPVEAEPLAVVGVLDLACDTATQDSGLVIVHGSAKRPSLKVGATAQTAPDETALAALIAVGIYPE